ncbi:MAG: AAA family ATPase, partial [Nitrospinota bacterium]
VDKIKCKKGVVEKSYFGIFSIYRLWQLKKSKNQKIKISNFKSFKDLEIELGKFNILIGSNASGKSNFLQIFKFLKDINNSGLNNALQMQGGVEYLRNIDTLIKRV